MDYLSRPSSLKNNNCLLRLENAEKRYGRTVVLNIEEFEVEHGSSIALLGENGSGKSTFLRILAGISSLSSGKRHISKKLSDVRITFVPQSGGTYNTLTVQENLDLYARLYGQKMYENPEKEWFIKDYGLDSYLNYPVSELSGGYQKITALACALSVNPHCLFLDEPFSGLDSDRKQKMSDALNKTSKQLYFMICTGHTPDELPFCTKHHTLTQGNLI
ncbi:MAG: ABC transporter ATP-binding protein [Gammaproteobacteria bacterium]|nr:ABC transporter ATP-binding protein [Gammaproteobacteria bacterium]